MEGMRAWCALNHACHSVIALLARQGHLGAQWHQLMTWGRCIGTTDIQVGTVDFAQEISQLCFLQLLTDPA